VDYDRVNPGVWEHWSAAMGDAGCFHIAFFARTAMKKKDSFFSAKKIPSAGSTFILVTLVVTS
jgi:hypothetical protein